MTAGRAEDVVLCRYCRLGSSDCGRSKLKTSTEFLEGWSASNAFTELAVNWGMASGVDSEVSFDGLRFPAAMMPFAERDL